MKTPFEIMLEVESLGPKEINKLPLSKLLYYKDVASQLTDDERKRIIELTRNKHLITCARCGDEIHCMRVRFGENFCSKCFQELTERRTSKNESA